MKFSVWLGAIVVASLLSVHMSTLASESPNADRVVADVVYYVEINKISRDLCATRFPTKRANTLAAYTNWEKRNSEIINVVQKHITFQEMELIKEPIKSIVLEKMGNGRSYCQARISMWRDMKHDFIVAHKAKITMLRQALEQLPKKLPARPALPLNDYAKRKSINLVASNQAMDAPSPDSQNFDQRYKALKVDGYVVVLRQKQNPIKIKDAIEKNLHILDRLHIKNVRSLDNGVSMSYSKANASVFVGAYKHFCGYRVIDRSGLLKKIYVTMETKYDNQKEYCNSLAFVLGANEFVMQSVQGVLVVGPPNKASQATPESGAPEL